MHRRRERRPGAKLLGLDLGERWIGVAITDDTGVLAAPLETLDLRRVGLDAVARIAAERGVAGIVVGLPRTLSGEEGFQARRAREQAAELASHTDLPIVFWDERLTTAMADQIAARRGRRKGGQHDAVAAAILLQSYIDTYPIRERRRPDDD
jgi:putative Holliday junction resolvase